jgi:4-hydroxy-2-oxoglutarate aldolase
MRFRGLYHPLVTPFTANGDIDTAGIAANARRLLATPLTGLVVLGSNGEQPQLDDDEADRVIAAVRDVVPAERPLFAGAARESTRATIAACRRAASLGVSAVMVRTPSFYKNMMTTDALVRHYTEVADHSPAPVLLYNVQIYTGLNLQPDAVGLLSEHPNIAGLKESGNDMTLLGEYVARAAPGFTVLCGSATSYFSALALGVHGAVLALAGVAPDACARLGSLVEAGRLSEARRVQRELMPLARTIGAEHGVPALKAAFALLGFAAGDPRPPLRPAPAPVIATLRAQLADLGLLPALVGESD